MGLPFEEFGSELHSWTVGELTAYIRELFDIDFRLKEVQVTGEISNFVRARSGHLYFTLKDESAQLKCVMWRSSAERLRYLPEDGDAVIAGGRISVYDAGGVYQLYADSLIPAGRGDLAIAFEQLKERLAAEGLFDQDNKQATPFIPQRIGIVTSVNAAALRDILNVLHRRWPMVSVLLAPTLVQGVEAPSQIVRAIQWLDGRNDINIIIVARGGGSIEDLWAFNDESVARAIFAARHPVIVGVGHETDYTIADFVGDVRAPTPSAAAELAVPDRNEIEAYVTGLQITLTQTMGRIIEEKRSSLHALAQALRHLNPQSELDNSRQKVDWLAGRLDMAISGLLQNRRTRLSIAQSTLETLSPFATLSRGYAIVRKQDETIVRSTDDVIKGDELTVQVADGEFGASVSGSESALRSKGDKDGSRS